MSTPPSKEKPPLPDHALQAANQLAKRAQLGAEGYEPPGTTNATGNPAGPEVGDRPILEKGDREVVEFRTIAGMTLGFVSVLAAFGGFWFAAKTLQDLAALHPKNADEANFLMVVIGAKAVVSGAFLGFCYALGRAGERFLIPYWWVRTESDRRAAMGVKDDAPPKSFRDLVDKLIEALGKK